MQPVNISKKSEDLKKDADRVIDQLKIKESLGQLGVVTFVGSYALDLLYRPDVDIFVQCHDPSRRMAVELTKRFLDSEFFQTVGFADWSVRKAPNGINGYYWELIHLSDKFQWKFDIWYTAIENQKTIEVTKRIAKLLAKMPEARQQILQQKYKYFDGVKYRDGMNGMKIYEAVLGKE